MTETEADMEFEFAPSKVTSAEQRDETNNSQLDWELHNLNCLRLLLKHYANAKELFAEVIDTQIRVFGRLYACTPESLLWNGELYEAEGSFSKSEKYYVAALWLLEQNEDCNPHLLEILLLRFYTLHANMKENEIPNPFLSAEATRWLDSYSSFLKAEISVDNVRQIRGAAAAGLVA